MRMAANPVELAQRLPTLEAWTRGRWTVGIRAGPTHSNHDAVGSDPDQRLSAHAVTAYVEQMP
jgi:alkanesulfonate monooxygenase SsuD/methylene tetrahydromethanopterin reductase-like flavin-dependent oxidoreductase (luciferase family)